MGSKEERGDIFPVLSTEGLSAYATGADSSPAAFRRGAKSSLLLVRGC
jgi:hypothetical protein